MKTSKQTNNDYLIVRVEDEAGKAYNLLDRDVENKSCYKRGKTCDFVLNLQLSRQYANLNIVKMEEC